MGAAIEVAGISVSSAMRMIISGMEKWEEALECELA